jgi:cbb3-type cytochrome oxidase maturation protein
MEIVYLLVPLAVLVAALVVWLFFWAIRSGQFDDLEGPAHRILMDDDKPRDEANGKGKDPSRSERSK